MHYINFVVITDTPGRLRDFLIARGIIEENAEGNLVGTRPGMEWVRVPNPIVTDPGPPAVYDTRNVYLVKFAHESLANEVDGATVDGEGNPIDTYDWSKFGKWVKANGAFQNAPAGWTVGGEPAGRAWKITGESVWLVRDNPERFGVWQ